MQETMEVIRNKQARGYILKLLELTNPNPVTSHSISSAMIQSGIIASPDIAAHIDYLAGKGYIEAKKLEMKTFDPNTYTLKLTPKGVDLLEETIDDPGVDI